MRAIGFLAILAIFVLPSLAHAQIGERAGPLTFNVSVGGNETIPWVIFNNGNSTVYFITYIGSLQQSDNQITPTITLNPSNGLIAAHSSTAINVTVFMPAQNQPGVGSWSTLLQVIQTSNQTVSGGSASIMAGLAKRMDIVSKLPPPTTTSTTTSPPTISQSGALAAGVAIPIIAVILVISGVTGLILARNKKKAAKKRQQARRRPRAKKRTKAARRARAAKSRKRTSRKRRRR